MPDTHTRTQHTPGPWTAQKRFDGHYEITHDEIGIIAWPNERIETDANARLIAAAPDLLAALEAIYECQVAHTSGGICHEDHDELNEIARAAIAKARGEDA